MSRSAETYGLELHLWRAIGSLRVIRGALSEKLSLERQLPKNIVFPDHFRNLVALHRDGTVNANDGHFRRYALERLKRIEKGGKPVYIAEYREVETPPN